MILPPVSKAGNEDDSMGYLKATNPEIALILDTTWRLYLYKIAGCAIGTVVFKIGHLSIVPATNRLRPTGDYD